MVGYFPVGSRLVLHRENFIFRRLKTKTNQHCSNRLIKNIDLYLEMGMSTGQEVLLSVVYESRKGPVMA